MQVPAALRRMDQAVRFEGLADEWKNKQRRTRPCIQRKLDAQASRKRRAQQLFKSQINAILTRKERCCLPVCRSTCRLPAACALADAVLCVHAALACKMTGCAWLQGLLGRGMDACSRFKHSAGSASHAAEAVITVTEAL